MLKRSVLLAAISAALSTTVVIAQPPMEDPTAPVDHPEPAVRNYSPEDLARRAKIVAKVGEATITVGDVEDQINQMAPFMRNRYRDRANLEEFIQGLVRMEILGAEAERRDYGDHPAVQKTTKQNAIQQMIRRNFDDRIRPETIAEEEVRAWYDGHLDEFRRPALVRASHILVDSRERALELIREMSAADNAAFRQAAREHSLDTETKLRGGDLRYFDREGRSPSPRDAAVDPALVAAAFELREVGDVAREPVQLGERWSIVKLTGRREAEERTYEEASEGIRLRLWRETRQSAIDEFVARLRRETPVEIHEERMTPIQLELVSPEDQQGFDPHGNHATELEQSMPSMLVPEAIEGHPPIEPPAEPPAE
jgi:parvulin-like peptidyl-prolyl isomerase